MSAVAAAPPVRPARVDSPAISGRVTQARVIRSEWTKLRSLRSTWWSLTVAVLLTVGFGALASWAEGRDYATMSPGERSVFNPASISLGGFGFAALAFGTLAVLMISGEYGTGMIRSSLTAVPRRLPVLWGKAVVLAGTVFTAALVASFGAFFLGQWLLDRNGLGVTIGSDGALASVIGAAVAAMVSALIGLALGALLRSSAAGISVFAAVFFVIPPLLQLLPASWTANFEQYLPASAATAMRGGGFGVADPLGWWPALAVLAGYAVVLLAGAAWALRQRDA